MTAVLESDLAGASKQLKLFKADKGVFPATVSTDCTASPSSEANLCIKPSSGNVVESYTSPGPHATFSLTILHGASGLSGTVTDSSGPAVSAGAAADEEGITIGSQTWAKTNVNVGTMISNSVNQANNGTIEKYCVWNDESKCDTHGGLYQWDEAMQYSAMPGAQGICPEGWRIPTDEDWKILEISLGMTRAQADSINYRGTDQGIKLMLGGSTGLNIPTPGFRLASGFANVGYSGYLWTSTAAYNRGLEDGGGRVIRYSTDKTSGFSVRCLKG